MADRPFKFGPVALTNTLTTNIFNPGTTTGGTACTSAPFDKLRVVIRHIRIVNKTGGVVSFTLYKGLTGANTAGTEYIGTAINVAANSAYDYYSPGDVFDTVDFLVGGASAGTSLTIEGSGIIVVA